MPRQTLKQRADGRYACKWQGLTFYGKTQKEALAARDAAKARAGEGLAQSVPFLADYAARWLPSAKSHCSTRNYNEMASYLNKLCAFLGPRRIDRVTPSDIR